MRINSICPYCSVTLIKAENKPNARSVEHLIPNTLLSRKRKNDEGDFYACRKCNSDKGILDEVFGVLTRSQSSNDDLASQALIRACTKNKNVPHRYARMLETVEIKEDGVHATMPITGDELIDYLTYYGKGLYFKKFGQIFREKREVMLMEVFNKQIHLEHSEGYSIQLSSNPIRDLEKNQYSEVIAENECVIWSKNRKFFVVFHDFIGCSLLTETEKYC